MSEEQEKQTTEVQQTTEEKKQELNIDIDPGTAFSLKMQEFDKKIAEAELTVATIKKDKSTFIYDSNVQQIVLHHREKVLETQIKEETKKKLSES